MAKKYKAADKATKKLVENLIEANHEGLSDAEVTVDVLLVIETEDDPEDRTVVLRRHGHPAEADVRITSAEMRTLGRSDVLLKLDSAVWGKADDADRRGIVDHQLQRLEVRRDKDGNVKLDEHGRPKLRIIREDWFVSGFHAVVRRNGAHAPEVRAVKACVGTDGQAFWDFGPKLVPAAAAAE